MATSRKPSGNRTSIKRPLGGTEKIYWLLDKLYSLNFAAYVVLDGKLDPEDLQAALSEVQEATPVQHTGAVLARQLAKAEQDPKCADHMEIIRYCFSAALTGAQEDEIRAEARAKENEQLALEGANPAGKRKAAAEMDEMDKKKGNQA